MASLRALKQRPPSTTNVTGAMQPTTSVTGAANSMNLCSQLQYTQPRRQFPCTDVHTRANKLHAANNTHLASPRERSHVRVRPPTSAFNKLRLCNVAEQQAICAQSMTRQRGASMNWNHISRRAIARPKKGCFGRAKDLRLSWTRQNVI